MNTCHARCERCAPAAHLEPRLPGLPKQPLLGLTYVDQCAHVVLDLVEDLGDGFQLGRLYHGHAEPCKRGARPGC